ncbi:hypothetical protein HID58_013530 [Brassica napus]|uniref:Uncharacterized protein n=1 Tax=Brassica napus TaxID=3708 RepID=A0ABQ8E6C2_BRANA|nr:hypothetical protein HID58_013530 [Brassica napus]
MEMENVRMGVTKVAVVIGVDVGVVMDTEVVTVVVEVEVNAEVDTSVVLDTMEVEDLTVGDTVAEVVMVVDTGVHVNYYT